MAEIYDSLLIAKPLSSNNGYTYTLTSKLGDMLISAQKLFGHRDTSYTILGFEFAGEIPHIWFPGNCKHIVIQLGLPCLQDPARAYFQLAHETIHLLSPTGCSNANVLEEGLATWFQLLYMRDYYPPAWPKKNISVTTKSYNEARTAVESLLSLDRDAIKKIRQQEPIISKIIPELILKVVPAFPAEQASILCQKFIR
jgi:hypothetical protein